MTVGETTESSGRQKHAPSLWDSPLVQSNDTKTCAFCKDSFCFPFLRRHLDVELLWDIICSWPFEGRALCHNSLFFFFFSLIFIILKRFLKPLLWPVWDSELEDNATC